MIVVGIDLGVTGAVSAVDSYGTACVEDLPIHEGVHGKRLDAGAAVRLLRQLMPANDAALVVMEDIRVRQMHGRGMSHSTETTLVGLRFAVQAACDIARIHVEVVQPQAWKKHFAIKDDKTGAKAREIASQLYPLQADKLKRVKDHNRAEALLLAHFGHARFA